MKHVLSSKQYNRQDLEELFELTDKIKAEPQKFSNKLKSKILSKIHIKDLIKLITSILNEKQIYFLRHAQAEHNIIKGINSRKIYDSKLTQEGIIVQKLTVAQSDCHIASALLLGLAGIGLLAAKQAGLPRRAKSEKSLSKARA